MSICGRLVAGYSLPRRPPRDATVRRSPPERRWMACSPLARALAGGLLPRLVFMAISALPAALTGQRQTAQYLLPQIAALFARAFGLALILLGPAPDGAIQLASFHCDAPMATRANCTAAV